MWADEGEIGRWLTAQLFVTRGKPATNGAPDASGRTARLSIWFEISIKAYISVTS